MSFTKDEIKELARECPNIVFHIHIYPEGVVVSPAPTPAPDPITEDEEIMFVNVKDKPSKQAKLRPSASSSVPELILVKDGSSVVYLGESHKDQTGEMFLMVKYKSFIGWIEQKYLVAK